MNNKKSYFTNYIRDRIIRNKNFLAVIVGGTGSGKSWSALKLGEMLDPNFNINNVVFTGKEFMGLVNGEVKELNSGSCLIFDEIQIALGHKSHQSIQSKLLNYILSTFRHKNFVLFFTTPFFGFIDASARKLLHAKLETISINKTKEQTILKPLLLQINQDTSKVYRKYLVVKSDGKYRKVKRLRLGRPSEKLICDYEEKKNKFTKELNEHVLGELNKLEKGNKAKDKPKLTPRQQEIVDLLKKGTLINEIAQRLGINPKNVYESLNLAKNKGIKIIPIKEVQKVIRYEVIEN